MKKLLLTIGGLSAVLGLLCLGVKASAAADPPADKAPTAATAPGAKASPPRVQVVTSLGKFTIVDPFCPHFPAAGEKTSG